MDELDPVEKLRLELAAVPRGPIRPVDEPWLLDGSGPNGNGTDPVPDPGPPPPLP